MDGIKVRIGEREIPLRFRMKQFQELEEQLGLLMDYENLFIKSRQRIKNVVTALCILGNGGLAHEGKEADLTEEWIMEEMIPQNFVAYQMAIIACLRREGKSEAAKEENENKERDLVLEEIQKKKAPESLPTDG